MLSHTIGGLDLVRSSAIGLDCSMHCHRVSVLVRLIAVQPAVAHSEYNLCRSMYVETCETDTYTGKHEVSLYVRTYLAPVLMKFLREEAL